MKRRKGLQGLPPDTTYHDVRSLGQEYKAQRLLEEKIKLEKPNDNIVSIAKRLRKNKRP